MERPGVAVKCVHEQQHRVRRSKRSNRNPSVAHSTAAKRPPVACFRSIWQNEATIIRRSALADFGRTNTLSVPATRGLSARTVELVVATAPDGSSHIDISERRRHGSEFAERSDLLFGRQRRGIGENVPQFLLKRATLELGFGLLSITRSSRLRTRTCPIAGSNAIETIARDSLMIRRTRRSSARASRVYCPCLRAFLLPRGAPEPGAPPCRQKPTLHGRFISERHSIFVPSPARRAILSSSHCVKLRC